VGACDRQPVPAQSNRDARHRVGARTNQRRHLGLRGLHPDGRGYQPWQLRGALVNARGELVGINTAIFSQNGGYQGVGFAVPSNLALRVVSELQEYGEVRRGAIGYVEIAPLTAQLAQQLGTPDLNGVLVRRMRRDTPAYEAGLRPGDVVVELGGTTITDGGHLSRLISDTAVGTTVTMTVIREGRRLDLMVQIERLTGSPTR